MSVQAGVGYRNDVTRGVPTGAQPQGAYMVTSGQHTDVTPVGGHYTISNVGNGMVLDALDCETANGTVVRQWAQLDNTCQQWNLTP